VWNRSDIANPINDRWKFHSFAVTKIFLLVHVVG
jgi:hypothetical protein